AREEPPGEVGVRPREEIQPLPHLERSPLVVPAAAEIQLQVLRAPGTFGVEGERGLAVERPPRRPVARIDGREVVSVPIVERELPFPERMPMPRRGHETPGARADPEESRVARRLETESPARAQRPHALASPGAEGEVPPPRSHHDVPAAGQDSIRELPR